MANSPHRDTVVVTHPVSTEPSVEPGAHDLMDPVVTDRRLMLQAMGTVLLTGCAGSPTRVASSMSASPPRRVSLTDVSGVDLFSIHAALQMEAANQVGGSAPDLMKEVLARTYHPDDGKTELMSRTGAGPAAIKSLYMGRFDESIAPRIARWTDVELTCNMRLNPRGSRYVEAKVDGLWRNGSLNFTQAVDMIDLPTSMTRGQQGPQGWNVKAVEWIPSIAGPRNSFELRLNDGTRGALTCKGFFDLPVRIPFDRMVLQQLITSKLTKDPDHRDRSSRQLIYDGDVEMALRPRLPALTNEREWWGVKTGRQIGRIEWMASVERISNVSIR